MLLRLPVVVILAATLVAALPAVADTTINVSLSDNGPDSVVMDDAHMAAMGKMDHALTPMLFVTLDQTTVKAGNITFAVTNGSKDFIHEFLVSPVRAGETALPYVTDENRVDEDLAGHLGEVSELDPDQSGSLTLDLTPGTYVVYCNIPGHFVSGMWSVLTVTP